jgi:hypothetical protein
MGIAVFFFASGTLNAIYEVKLIHVLVMILHGIRFIKYLANKKQGRQR